MVQRLEDIRSLRYLQFLLVFPCGQMQVTVAVLAIMPAFEDARRKKNKWHQGWKWNTS